MTVRAPDDNSQNAPHSDRQKYRRRISHSDIQSRERTGGEPQKHTPENLRRADSATIRQLTVGKPNDDSENSRSRERRRNHPSAPAEPAKQPAENREQRRRYQKIPGIPPNVEPSRRLMRRNTEKKQLRRDRNDHLYQMDRRRGAAQGALFHILTVREIIPALTPSISVSGTTSYIQLVCAPSIVISSSSIVITAQSGLSKNHVFFA